MSADECLNEPGPSPELAVELQRQVRSTYGPEVIEDEGGFASLYAMPGQVGLFSRRCRNPVLVTGASCLGPKLALARRFGRHETLGVDLVALCVNDVLVAGALPLFFLSCVAGGSLDSRQQLDVVKGIAEGCREADCALLGTGVPRSSSCLSVPSTHEMHAQAGAWAWHPASGEYELAGFAVGMVERARLIDGRRRVRPGDALLGLHAAGLHAGGVALAGKVLLDTARLAIEDVAPELGCSVADELLRPTRLYVRPLRAVLDHYRVKGVVHALAHMAGGLTSDVPRALGRRCVARIATASWPRPPVFEMIARLGGIPDAEMFRVFNMGIGMVAAVSPYYADAIIDLLRRRGQAATVIGEVARGEGPAAVLG